MSWQLIHGDALHVSDLLEPESVDLIVTSPPYFALRSYRDDGEHYDGQIGSEATPGEFVDALIACTRDWLRVLRPGGSIFVNLGDKYANAAPSGTAGYIGAGAGGQWDDVSDTLPPIRTDQFGIKTKSLMGLPWRYALRCIDELGLILRAEIVWSKPNGLPESVTDRVRRSHEQWFHFTRQGRYFAAIDEVREEHSGGSNYGRSDGQAPPAGKLARQVANGDRGGTIGGTNPDLFNPLGKVPGSVWTIPSEPLVVPDALGVDHFAAFPSELPRRLVLGWSPSGYCTVCDQPRRAVVERKPMVWRESPTIAGRSAPGASLKPASGTMLEAPETRITGYVCDCTPYTDHPGQRIPASERTGNRLAVDPGNVPRQTTGSLGNAPRVGSWREYHHDDWTPAPTRPAVVLDPFAGTGTTPAVAHLLGRHGIGIDLSKDYLRLAEWRCTSDQRLRDKVLDRTGIPNPDPPAINGQLDLFAEWA